MTRPSEEARKYIGQREIKGNQGFIDPKFQAEMTEEGFVKGYAWCALFAKVVFVNCYPEKTAELRKLFVPGVLNTFRNLRDAAYPVGNLPQIDSLVCWRQMKDGKPTGFGHCGIVSQLIEQTGSAVRSRGVGGFKSIEGNTGIGDIREGIAVGENFHALSGPVKSGLDLLGFVHIPPPTHLTLNV